MLQLKKFPDIHVSNREEARGSRTHPGEPRFHLLARDEGSFPCFVGKNFHCSRRNSRGGAIHRIGERNSRVMPPFQVSPRCVSPFQRNLFSLHCLDVQAEDRLPPRVHLGQPFGKASWESLVRKTRGKTIDPLIHAADCVTCCYRSGGKHKCMPAFETRTDSPGESPEVPQDPCQHWRGILRFRPRLHTRS